MEKQAKIKSEDFKKVFEVLSEFVTGFEKMNGLHPSISIFGSARTKANTKYYNKTVALSKKLVEAGFGIITGGGPGIMEAANKGAFENNGTSVGLNIELPMEQDHNPFIDENKLINHQFFFVRKVLFVKYSNAIIVMPGGFGTLDELFEVLTLIQNEKINPMPVILFGTEFWKDLEVWITKVLQKQFKTISPHDLDLIRITDDIDEVVKIIVDFHSKRHSKQLDYNYNFYD